MRAGLARWTADAVAGREGLRVVPEASLHVTLMFLGATDPADVARIWTAVPAGHPAPQLAGSGVVALPRRRPRAFALGLDDLGGGAAALQGRIADRLGEGEGRPWLPHVTLARVRKGARVTHLSTEAPVLDAFAPPAVALLRSHPGSRYQTVERAELMAQSS